MRRPWGNSQGPCGGSHPKRRAGPGSQPSGQAQTEASRCITSVPVWTPSGGPGLGSPSPYKDEPSLTRQRCAQTCRLVPRLCLRSGYPRPPSPRHLC